MPNNWQSEVEVGLFAGHDNLPIALGSQREVFAESNLKVNIIKVN